MSAIDDCWVDALAGAITGKATALPLPEGFPQPEAHRPEDAAILRIVALGTYRLAGAPLAADGFSPLEEMTLDPRECPPAAAAGLAALMREGIDASLARYWVSVAAERGLSVPPELAGRLAAFYAGNGSELPSGPFDAWTAWVGQEPAEGDEEAFSSLSGAARTARLAAWRGRDADAAREALAATFPLENAEARAGLVGALAQGLSDRDEAFLQACLADRSKEVRNAAASLLVRLPASAFAARYAARARTCVAMEGAGLRVVFDDAQKPGDDWLSREAITGRGTIRMELYVPVAAAPLSTWGERPAAEWVAAARRNRWERELTAAWAAAAERERDGAWALALLDGLTDREMGGNSIDLGVAIAALGALSQAEWERAVPRLIGNSLGNAMRLLDSSPGDAWSGPFTDVVLGNLEAILARHVPERWAQPVPLDPVILRADPAKAGDMAAIAARMNPNGEAPYLDAVNAAAAAMERRRAILQSFGP